MKTSTFLLCLSFTVSCFLTGNAAYAQHDHHVDDTKNSHNHLAHMQASRAQNFYIHNLPAPKLMTGIGQSKMKIDTKFEKTQQYFNQGLNLLHDFWDFEAYRAFKEAIRNDSTAIMPYWGMLQSPGPDEDSILTKQKKEAVNQLKKLLKTANEHEKLYAEIALLGDSLKEKAYLEMAKKYEQIVHQFPHDIDAKLFLALSKISGFDSDLKPNEGQMYSEYLLRDIERQELELGYGEPPLYARPVAVSIARANEKAGQFDKAIEAYNTLLKRFPKSAYVYGGLLGVYKKKGDAEKTKEYTLKLNEAMQYGDR